MTRILMIDCGSAGISGDMLLGALLDLGADPEIVRKAVSDCGRYLSECSEIDLKVRDVLRHGLRAKKVELRFTDKAEERKGKELIAAVEEALRHQGITGRPERVALSSIQAIVRAEASLHATQEEEVNLHELGSVDTVAEMVGVAAAMQSLGIGYETKIYSTPVALGGGKVSFSHGETSSPSPATLEILKRKGFDAFGGPVETELTTPTGAALLVSMVDEVNRFYPPMKVQTTGFGAGEKELPNTPNILRLSLGEDTEISLPMEEVVILEANLDDTTPEILGYAMEKLLALGAKDVSFVPIYTKKNRPATMLMVITDKASAAQLARTVVEETGTLGVRIMPVKRYVALREEFSVDVEVAGQTRKVRVKIAKDNAGKVVQVKPEFEDVKRLADETKLPIRWILERATEKAKDRLESK